MLSEMFDMFVQSFWETLIMVGISGLVGAAIGLPLGVLLYLTDRDGVLQNIAANRVMGVIVNAVRSTPFIILLVAVIPFTRLVVGSSIGTAAAIVPLTIGAARSRSRPHRSRPGHGREHQPDRLQGAAARVAARRGGGAHHHVHLARRLFGDGGRDWRRRSWRPRHPLRLSALRA